MGGAKTSAPRAPAWSMGERGFLAAAIIVALVLRLVHWKSMAPYPWFDFLGLDAWFYDDWAKRLVADGWLGEDPYFMGPLYPHILAVIYSVVGHSLDAVRVLQVLLSTATVGVAHVFARAYGGSRLACVTSALAAVYGPFVYYSVSILYPTITVFLAILLLIALHRAAEQRSRAWTVAAGVTLGIFALGRGNILLFAPVAFAWLVTAWGRPFAPALRVSRAGLRAGVILAVSTLACILPATFHNLLTGDVTLLTTNGGLNFYIGNGPMANGAHVTPVIEVRHEDGTVEMIAGDLSKDPECRTEAERAAGRSMRYTEVSHFYTQLTLDTIRENPQRFLSLLLKKFVHFWSDYEIPQIEHFGYFRQYSAVLKGPALTFGMLVPLSFVGMAFALRRRARYALPALFTATYCGVVVVFFVLARYRMPVVPALILFAALAIVEVATALRARRWLPAGIAVAGVVLGGVMVRANPYGVDDQKAIAQIRYRHGIVADADRDWEAAVGHYRDALALNPAYAKCHMNLGVDLWRLGRGDEAMHHLLRAEELDPAYYRAPLNRAKVLEELGRPEEALIAYRRAVELEPRYLLARVGLAQLLLERGDREEAEEQITAIEEYEDRWISPGHELARQQGGVLRAYLGQRDDLSDRGVPDCWDESEAFRRAEIARLRGNSADALARLGQYFAEGGRCAEAYRSLGVVLTAVGEPEGARDALLRARDAEPRLPRVNLGLARLAAAEGDADSALEALVEEMRIDPEATEPYLEAGLVHDRLRRDPEAAQQWFDRYLERGGDPGIIAGRRSAWRRHVDSTPEPSP